MMTNITIKELTPDNWREAAKLDVEEDQRGFVAPNVWSIALSKYLPEWIPAAIYNDDTMVGFAFYGERAQQTWHIMRFMIDKRYQGKGYGKAAMRELIRTIIEANPDCHTIDLSYAPENEVARKVYADVGFRETGEVHEGAGVDEREVVAALDLRADSVRAEGDRANE
jgi:diamine N-acetyltransferase